jgi:hypothetical protein
MLKVENIFLLYADEKININSNSHINLRFQIQPEIKMFNLTI